MWDDPLWLRRIANFLFGVCALALLVTVGHYLIQRPEFALRSVEVTRPLRHVSKELLVRMMHEQIQGNFFTVNLNRTRLALEQVPWVHKVSVRRKFPWALEVEVEEQQAVAHWNENELVNRYGEVFAGQTEQSLPDFIGQTGSSAQVLQMYVELTRELLPLGQTLTQISLTPRFAWQVRLSGGMTLELGHEQMQQRLARFVAVYPYSLGKFSRDRQLVDLRYRNGFTAHVRNGADEPQKMDSDNRV